MRERERETEREGGDGDVARDFFGAGDSSTHSAINEHVVSWRLLALKVLLVAIIAPPADIATIMCTHAAC